MKLCNGAHIPEEVLTGTNKVTFTVDLVEKEIIKNTDRVLADRIMQGILQRTFRRMELDAVGSKDFIRGYSGLSLRPMGPLPRTLKIVQPLMVAHFRFDTDISPLFPYINAVVEGASFFDLPLHIQFNLDNFLCNLHPADGVVGMCENHLEAHELVERLIAFLNDLHRRKAAIRPNHKKRSRTSVLEIYELLPRDNCRECGYLTCMAFAAALSLQQVDPTDCPGLGLPVQQQASYPVYDDQGNLKKTIDIHIDTSRLAQSLKDRNRRIEKLENELVKLTRIDKAFAARVNQLLPAALTNRELQVLQLLGRGATNMEISDLLKISPHTVKSHVIHIFNKLGVDDRTEASVWAARNGLL